MRIGRLLILVALAAPAAAGAEPVILAGQPGQVLVSSPLQGIAPLAPGELGGLRGGTAGLPAPIRPASPGVQFWDELARPRPPSLPQDGTVSSGSRGLR